MKDDEDSEWEDIRPIHEENVRTHEIMQYNLKETPTMVGSGRIVGVSGLG